MPIVSSMGSEEKVRNRAVPLPSLPWRCQLQAGQVQRVPRAPVDPLPSISVHASPATQNTIASHEWRCTVLTAPGSISCAVASIDRVGRPPSAPT